MTFPIGKYANIVINNDNTLLAINSSGPKSVGNGSPPKCAMCLTSAINSSGPKSVGNGSPPKCALCLTSGNGPIRKYEEISFGCDIGQQNIFSIHGVCKTNSSFRLTREMPKMASSFH
ncbi:uncharacterized protein LACBIDRAFT_322413 [Laccaria bicolor S238N-H82]|uniref:Predicted protein n=1 Tax=Laccaria bicolor (strain S238N-H82 / ATCC MYA-4686) TaxID=486041 RepID=B0CW70_LACBS|nr:uncharacterized protein LACBIDRAFT_322413 [Laccaria bicolor S238N-H82]EDR13457.1 predicted protein [Laccaria bicolor S238N-H82]|eukprot:XP_001875955.1 predicted protein [Laccaria bicolor S238N-H82]